MPKGSTENVWDFLEGGRGAGTPRGSPPSAGLSRIKTHVSGLDEALGGGVPQGNLVVLRGGPGTLKSTLAFHILLQNAAVEGHKGIYLSLEQDTASFQRQLDSQGFTWNELLIPVSIVDVGSLRREGITEANDWTDFIYSMVARAREQGTSLLVIDSLEAMEAIVQIRNLRHDLFRLFTYLRDLGLTVIVISERAPHEGAVQRGARIEDYLSDGILETQFYPTSGDEFQRRIRILKMRNTRHDTTAMALVWDEGALKAVKVIAQQAD